jgi:hypothetical protein
MKLLFTTAFCIAFSSPGWAQQFLPRLGLSLSTVQLGEGFVAPGYQTIPRAGTVAGLEMRLPFNAKTGMAIDVLFHQKGWNGVWEFNTVKYEETVKMNYIEVVALPFVKVSPFYFMAGPSFAVGVGGRSTQTQSQNGRFIIEYKSKFEFDKKIDLSGLLVAGIEIKNKIFFDVRYQRSFTNFFESTNNTPAKNISLQFTAGYLLGEW